MFSASGAVAATDLTCDGAFGSDDSVKSGSYKICGQDVALNTFTLGLGSLVYTVPSVKKIYNAFGIGLSNQSNGSVVATLPVFAVAKAVVVLGTILTLGAFAFRLWFTGVRVMKQGGIAQMGRDPETWKAGSVLAMVAILGYHSDGLIVAQLLVVFVFLASLSAVSFMLSSMIHVFDFSATVSDSAFDNVTGFEGEATQFASSVVSSSLVAQNTALLNNFLYSGLEDVEHRKIEKNDSNLSGLESLIAALKNMISGMSSDDSSLDNYISGRFGDTVAMIPHPKSFGLATNSGLAISLADSGFLPQSDWSTGSEKKGGLPYWQHSKGILDLFSSQYILTSSPSLKPGIGGVKFNELMAKVSPVAGTLINRWGVDIDPSGIRAIADEVSKLLNDDNSDYTKDEILTAVQMIALGAIYPGSVTGTRANESMDYLYINPITAAASLGSGKNTAISDKIFRAGFEAANHLRAYKCLTNLGAYVMDVEAWYSLNKDGDQSSLMGKTAKSVFESGDFMGQCLTVIPREGKYNIDFVFGLNNTGTNVTEQGKVIRDAIKTVMKAAQEKAVSKTFAATALTNELMADPSLSTLATDELTAARKQMAVISNYYKTIALVSNKALLLGADEGEKDKSAAMLASIRKQGVMSLGSYILQLSDIQRAFSNALQGGDPDMNINTYLDISTGTLPMRGGVETSNEKAFSLFVKSFADQFSALQSGDNASVAVTKTVSNVQNDAANSVNDYSAYLMDMLIPGDDILKKGFGLNEDDGLVSSLQKCSFGMNCVNFTQHPLATISLFGKNLLTTGLMFKTADAVIQAVDMFVTNTGSSTNDVDMNSGSVGKLLGPAAKIVQMFKFFTVGNAILMIIHVVAIMSGIASSIATGFIIAGVFLGYLLPFMPMMAMFMMCLAWIAEGLLLFLAIPFLLPLVIITMGEGKTLFKPTSLISMYASLFLRGPLIFIGFLIFYSLSYGAIYAANSLIFNVIGTSDFNQGGVSGFLVTAVEYLIMFILLGVLYHATFKTLTEIMVKTPNYVLQNLGANGLNVSVSNGWEQMVQASVIGKYFTGATDELKGGLKNSIAGSERDKISRKLAEKGHDLNELLK